ncbi:MAG: hypothetical protein ACFFGZ_07820 [Candidatus Thorarchaeota archaeon]
MAADNMFFAVQLFSAACSAIGFVIFTWALLYSRKIVSLLKDTRIVKKWRIASILVAFFSFGYVINIPLIFIVDFELLLIIEGLIFLFGAIFVLLVFAIAYQTYNLIYSIPDSP